MFPCCVVMGSRPAAVTTDQPPEHSPGAARRLAATARGSGGTGSAEPGRIPGAGRLHRAWTGPRSSTAAGPAGHPPSVVDHHPQQRQRHVRDVETLLQALLPDGS